ncbi:Hypothetical protein CINCED_3A018757 [Cinara cedri]|uniref:Resistance to inhibitors of cholinesterase protein 3 N-terminal domain-containing protein n=1 Tax=Cinara cedri TaxID=506608 RepID=A0A5E4NAJ9_9HEMI|nr:Hypothetical protein CINCED_3A018757 [Cinara cedri]
MPAEISQSKTICILAIVAGCFAVLWPSLFYPMLKGSFAPHTQTDNIPQERTPVHLRASMHPALMEKGRAIPQPHIGSRQATPGSFKQPIPGYRPPMGGMGGTGQKTRGGAMNILMPMYTIGIVLFFVYTMMKLLSKKDNVEEKNTNGAFSSRYDCSGIDSSSKLQSLIPPTQLGDLEIDALRRKLEETEAAMERIVKQMILASECNGMDGNKEFKNDETDEKKFQENTISNHSDNDIDDNTNTKIFTQLEESASIESSKPKETCNTGEEETTDLEISNKKVIQVVNMETSESVGGGHCWTQIEKEKISSKDKMVSSSPIEKPISLIIPGTIPKNSQVLISDGPHNTSSETEDHEAIISSKVTLSLIPDDRVEEYLTSDEAEGDNIISTQSDTK